MHFLYLHCDDSSNLWGYFYKSLNLQIVNFLELLFVWQQDKDNMFSIFTEEVENIKIQTVMQQHTLNSQSFLLSQFNQVQLLRLFPLFADTFFLVYSFRSTDRAASLSLSLWFYKDF